MSFTGALESLASNLARAVGARVRYTFPPSGVPDSYPAIVVAWRETVPTASNYSVRDALGNATRMRSGRTHSGSYTVFLGLMSEVPDDYQMMAGACQSVLDAFDADETLRGEGATDQCAKCESTGCRPFFETIAGSAAGLIGVRGEFRIYEV